MGGLKLNVSLHVCFYGCINVFLVHDYQPLFFYFLRRNLLKRFRRASSSCVDTFFANFAKSDARNQLSNFAFILVSFSCGFLFFWCWCAFSSLAFFLSHWYFPRKTPHKAISCGFFFFSLVTAFCLSLLFFPFSFLSCSFFFF